LLATLSSTQALPVLLKYSQDHPPVLLQGGKQAK